MYKVPANGLTYPIQQINGQRISGPPLEWVGKEPPCDEHEVYKFFFSIVLSLNVFLRVYYLFRSTLQICQETCMKRICCHYFQSVELYIRCV